MSKSSGNGGGPDVPDEAGMEAIRRAASSPKVLAELERRRRAAEAKAARAQRRAEAREARVKRRLERAEAKARKKAEARLRQKYKDQG